LFPFIHGLLYDFMDVDMTCGFENFNALNLQGTNQHSCITKLLDT